MRIADLLRTTVVDTHGRQLGKVRDVHLIMDGPLRSSGLAAMRVHGLVAGRTAFATRLGYENREGVDASRETRGPLLVRVIVRWLHRNAVYIPWESIIEITEARVTVSRTSGPTAS